MGALCWALAACGGPREPWGQLGGERGARAPPRFEQRVPDRRPRLARVQTKRKPPLRPGSAPLRLRHPALREPVSGAAHEPRAACARAGPHCRGHLVAGLSASPDPEQHPASSARPEPTPPPCSGPLITSNSRWTERATELGIVSGIQEFGKQVRTEFAFQQPLDIRVNMNLSARKKLRALPNVFEKSSNTTIKSSDLPVGLTKTKNRPSPPHPLRSRRLGWIPLTGCGW